MPVEIRVLNGAGVIPSGEDADILAECCADSRQSILRNFQKRNPWYVKRGM